MDCISDSESDGIALGPDEQIGDPWAEEEGVDIAIGPDAGVEVLPFFYPHPFLCARSLCCADMTH